MGCLRMQGPPIIRWLNVFMHYYTKHMHYLYIIYTFYMQCIIVYNDVYGKYKSICTLCM